ncbi:hypothetical protein CI238_06471, partial [Colletotrichum incanum]
NSGNRPPTTAQLDRKRRKHSNLASVSTPIRGKRFRPPPSQPHTMPLDEYASAVGGGLKLKGAKVGKPKKKKRRDKSDLEKNLETGDEGGGTSGTSGALVRHRDDAASEDDNRKKKSKKRGGSQDPGAEADAEESRDDDGRVVQKTEAERRYEERKRKRLLELAESSSSRPELLKTHKERVEELNTYLSKLSEHHDMPKIGPG